jgi:hypothetical protein
VLLDGSFLYLNLYGLLTLRVGAVDPGERTVHGLTYRAKSSDNRNISIQWQYRGSLSYITGAHSFKTGFNNMTASSSMFTYLISPPLTYRIQQRRAESVHRVRVALDCGLEYRRGPWPLRAGQMDARAHDAFRRAPIRLLQDQLPRDDGSVQRCTRQTATS